MSEIQKYCKVYQAANILGIGAATVRQMIKDGIIKGKKFGNSDNSPYFIELESLNKLK